MNRVRTSREDDPVLAWGAVLRQDKIRTQSHRRRRCVTFASGLAISLLAVTTIAPPTPRLVWNASASAPLGLYRVSPGERIGAGSMVVARMPAQWRTFADARGYLPFAVPLVKRVAAVAGQTVCAQADHVAIDGHIRAERLAADAHARPLPWWNGCRVLRQGEVFLLMADSADSFDGRYFGITTGRDIVGSARLILPRPAWMGGWR